MQIIPRGQNKWLLKQYLGLHPDTGKRQFATKMFTGTYAQATKEGTKWQFQKDQGTFTAPTKVLLSAYLSSWLQGKVSISAKTLSGYSERLQSDVLPLLGHIKLDALSRSHVTQMVSQCVSRGHSRRTIQYTLVVLNGAMEQAVTDGLIGKNPCRGVELPPKEHVERVILTLGQIQTLLGHPSPLRAYWTFLLTTGVRPNEGLAVEWKDIDLDAGLVTIRRALKETTPGKRLIGETKTRGSVRTIPLPQVTVGVLRELKVTQAKQMLKRGATYQRQDIVFAGKDGKHLDYSAVARHWKRDLEAAGLPVVRVYDARHSYATLLLGSGENLKVASHLLGHSSVQITGDTYSHVQVSHVQAVSGKLDALLSSTGT